MSGSVTIIDNTGRPGVEVEQIVQFVLDRCGGIERSLAIKLDAGGGGGYASDRARHAFPKWARRARYAIRCSVPSDEDPRYGRAYVCGHATKYGRFASDEYNKMYDSGVRFIKRWPLYCVNDWREWLVHILAHEAMHVVQFDRDRRSISEVHCEVFAAHVLDDYRSARAILEVER